MRRGSRIAVTVALAALLSPLATSAATLHVLLDHDHDQAAPPMDADAGLHGHGHDPGTPHHEHGMASPSLAVRQASPVVGVSGALAFAVTWLNHPAHILTAADVSTIDRAGPAPPAPVRILRV